MSGVDLNLVDGAWPFAVENERAIAEHWERRRRGSPGFFNGVVYVLVAYSVSEDGILSGRLVRTDFRSNLYWRETGWRDASVMDAFASALIFSAEGHLLVGRQRAGNLNSGLCYPPGGFLDAQDIAADGRIDIDASAARETAEEAGLSPSHLGRAGDYVIAMVGGLMSIGVPFRSRLSGAALLAEATRHIADDAESEVAEFLLVRPGEAHTLPMPDYSRVMIAQLPDLKTPA
ncbi:MAG: NUDIX hydrolase [Hyphomicrobium sp.]|uniref:NUDIX hydrolase n=1 Tax=Hyphomicrobium sp. TaxID=82 RepID=UPI003D14365B